MVHTFARKGFSGGEVELERGTLGVGKKPPSPWVI